MMLGFLGDLLGLNAGGATMDAAAGNARTINAYNKTGKGIINQGATVAGNNLNKVTDLYRGQVDRGRQGTALYDDALGLNGPDGSSRATAAFQTNPGYQFQRDQGIQALDRSASARGSFQSGGAMADVLDYSQGLADQSYGSWLDRLAGYENTLNTGNAGMAGGLNNLANLATGTASQRLGLAGDVTSAQLGANNQYAQGKEANTAGVASLGSNLMGMAGKAFGWGGF